MVSQDNKNDATIFALDKWLLRLGLWRHDHDFRSPPAQRKKALKSVLKQRGNKVNPFVLTGSDSDSDGGILASVISTTSYDEATGVFEDKITYWRHFSEGNLNPAEPEKEDQFVLSIRGRRDVNQGDDEIANILPDQIWLNGKAIFTATMQGGNDHPFDNDQRRLMNWACDLSQQVKLHLNEKRPVHEIGSLFKGDQLTGNFSEQALGAAPVLRGLTEDGKWDPAESMVHRYFSKVVDGAAGLSQQIHFTLPALDGIGAIDRLKAVMGYDYNTVEPLRAMLHGRDSLSVDRSGGEFLTRAIYEQDKKSGNHVFMLRVEPNDAISDMAQHDPFDMARVEFSQDSENSVFTLEKAEFMGCGAQHITSKMDKHNVIGFMQQSHRYLSQREYPPYHDIASEYGLEKHLNEWHLPRALTDGGELNWMPLFGTNLDKKIDGMGDGLGGGNSFIQRGLDENGQLDEIAILDDLPFQPGSFENSQMDGIQPNILEPRLRKALARGILIFSHGHFDHDSVSYLASIRESDGRGALQGQKILLKEYDYSKIRKNLAKLRIPKEQWPDFIVYDRAGEVDRRPDLTQVDDHNFVYRLRDEQGHTRFFVQILKNGSKHTTPTDQALITGCYDDQFNDTYYLDHDAFGMNDHARKFMREGQLALAEIYDDVDRKDLLKAVPSQKRLYISLEECTSLDKPGRTPENSVIESHARMLMRSIPDNHAVMFVPFSTNHEEISLFTKIWGEEETLRDYTSVGANMQDRMTTLNAHGYDLDLDFETVNIPPNKIPDEIYNAARDGVRNILEKRIENAAQKSQKKRVKMTRDQLLKQDKIFKIFNYIEKRCAVAHKKGQLKPRILFDLFLSGDENAFKNLAIKRKIIGENDEFNAPKDVMNALDVLKDRLLEEGADPKRDTALWMVKSILSYSQKLGEEKKDNHCGKIYFKASNGAINNAHMYQAIINGQSRAALHATRGSKMVKDDFRSDYGHFAILATDPIGTYTGDKGTMSKSAIGTSVLDFDELTRNSGLKMDMSKSVWVVPQTPSMGPEARAVQDEYLTRFARNRNTTIIHSYREGIRIINPKQHRSHYENVMRSAGFRTEEDPSTGELYIPDFTIHREGHRRFLDMVDKQQHKDFKAKAVAAIHIANWLCHERLKEAVELGGRIVGVENPTDWVARECVYDKSTGSCDLINRSVHNPQYMGVQIISKYAQQYSQIVRMIPFVFHRSEGSNNLDPLRIRSRDSKGPSLQKAFKDAQGFDLANDNVPNLRQFKLGPSEADIMPESRKPLTEPTGTLCYNKNQQELLLPSKENL